METVCVVLVTYNRLKLLKECIRGIHSQTKRVDKIIIVDNSSTDGTRDWLTSIESENIEVIFQDNLGGAGGFHTGVKAAYEQGYDWIWLMDDDVEAHCECLSTLLEYSNKSQCLHPLKIFNNGIPMAWEHFINPANGKKTFFNNYSFKSGKSYCYVNVGNFEGMLISRKIVSKIGFPNPNYFIVEDDTEYGFLASMHTDVAYIKDAVLYRKKDSEDDNILTPFFLYYVIRNRHLLRAVFKKYELINEKHFDDESTLILLKWIKFIVFKYKKTSFKGKIKLLQTAFKANKDRKKEKVGKTH